jgi:hypothetical protein
VNDENMRSIILGVLTQRGEEDPDEGDAWLGYWTPDWAYLKVGELTDALCDALEAGREQ